MTSYFFIEDEYGNRKRITLEEYNALTMEDLAGKKISLIEDSRFETVTKELLKDILETLRRIEELLGRE